MRLDPSRSRQTGDTGPGLSIVQGIMERLDGTVVLTDSLDLGGAEVMLNWPLAVS